MQSLTIWGVVVSVFGASLVQLGFSEGCSNEIVAILPVLVGGMMSWYGRVRAGGVSVLGRRV